MEFSYNRSIPKDLQDAIDYYDRVSDTKGDQFFEEFLSAVKEISQNPQRFPPFQETRLRKARLRKFPYHVGIPYDITVCSWSEDSMRIPSPLICDLLNPSSAAVRSTLILLVG